MSSGSAGAGGGGGGWLVVLDRAGRDVKRFELRSGAATLGSDPACDIRVMLPTVSPHHATVSVMYNQTVVRSVSAGATLVNGAPVSVAALRHGDVLALGGRALRWEYAAPAPHHAPRGPLAPQTALVRRVNRSGRGRAPRRASDPPHRKVIVPEHRATMPGSTSGKQVAIVQPQRRDTSDLSDSASPRLPPSKRARVSRTSEGQEAGGGGGGGGGARRKPSSPNLNNTTTTKATLWIESRKSSPRKSSKPPAASTPNTGSRARRAGSARKATPLRLVVLKKAQSAHKHNVTKIQAPLKIDSTKQAAIMLMTRHTPKSKQTSPNQGNRGPSFVVKRPSPVTRGPTRGPSGDTPRNKRASGKRATSASYRHSSINVSANGPSVIELTDSETPSSIRESNIARRSGTSSLGSLASPRKSALKDPTKRGGRKTDSIKFDLSNLDNDRPDRSSDVLLLEDTNDPTENDFTLRYSESSRSPSPRKSINSRSRRMLENSLGASVTLSPAKSERTTRESPRESPRSKSLRGSIILQEALRINQSDGANVSTYSRRTTKSLSDASWSTTVASTRRTRTDLESYSIVDLVSMDSNDSTGSGSVYTSADSDLTAVGSSTPYVQRASSKKRGKRSSPRTDPSVTTPENSEDTAKTITLNSTKISRTSKKRFRNLTRQNALAFLDDEMSEDDASPKSSKRASRADASPLVPKNISANETFASEGTHTPENRRSPVEASTPVLSIQSLLNASRNSGKSPITAGRRVSKRITIAAGRSEPRPSRGPVKSKSLSFRRSGRGREVTAEVNVTPPRSAAEPLPEGVKNKHSSAKRPQSKRSLIDELNDSDVVKQLFSSPVKRKLSQSMTEFSRRLPPEERRPTRATIAAAPSTPDGSFDRTERFTPDVFVSPLDTPTASPDVTSVRRLFQKTTPENDLTDIRGVRSLLRTPRTRKSKNDLTNVSGVKEVFARSPRNRLSDVRVKEVFAASPRNDLRRVSGVKTLFGSQRKRKSPRNELEDLRGVRTLFKDSSPQNDLRNVSGVKRVMRRQSPRNDLSDVRGVKRMFRLERQRDDLSDVSGVERLYQEPSRLDTTFDQLMGRPPLRAVYTKSKSFTTSRKAPKRGGTRHAKSLQEISLITNNVEEWLQKKLAERLHRNKTETSTKGRTSLNKSSSSNKSLNKSRSVSKAMRELQKLTTDTVEGSDPVIVSRTRNSSTIVQADRSRQKSASELYGAHMLPIKKRSLVEAISKADRSHKLPIKKRAVLHSTPVKGRVHVTMNASEIGRMSPISSEDRSARIETTIRSPPRQASKTKSPPKAKPQTPVKEKSVEVAKPSPKKTRSSKAVANTAPARPKRGRKSKAENAEVLNVKKRRSSIVIAKKTPVMSPKPTPKVTRKGKAAEKQDLPKASPKKTRGRGQKAEASELKPATPKKTRAKVTQTSVVVTKPSPTLKPRGTRAAAKETADKPTQEKPKRPRKVTITEPEPQKGNDEPNVEKSKRNKPQEKGKKNKQVDEPKVEKSKGNSRKTTAETTVNKSSSIVQTRRTRKAAGDAQTESASDKSDKSNAQARRTRKNYNKSVEPKSQNIEAKETSTRRGRKAQVDDTAPEPKKGRGRSTAVQSASKSVTKGESDASKSVTKGESETKVTRGRRTKQVAEDNEKTAPVEMPTGRGRKRKNTERDVSVIDNAKKETQSKKRVEKEDKSTTEKSTKRSTRRGAGDTADAAPDKLSKAGATESRPKTRKATVAADKMKGIKTTPVEESVPPASGRKKRSNVQITDAKETKKEPTKKARKSAVTPPAPRATRGTVGARRR